MDVLQWYLAGSGKKATSVMVVRLWCGGVCFLLSCTHTSCFTNNFIGLLKSPGTAAKPSTMRCRCPGLTQEISLEWSASCSCLLSVFVTCFFALIACNEDSFQWGKHVSKLRNYKELQLFLRRIASFVQNPISTLSFNYIFNIVSLKMSNVWPTNIIIKKRLGEYH